MSIKESVGIGPISISRPLPDGTVIRNVGYIVDPPFTMVLKKRTTEILTEDTIRVQENREVYTNVFGHGPTNIFYSNEKILSGKEVNKADIILSQFLGVKKKIVWKRSR